MREKAISPLRQRMIEDMRSVRKSDDQSGSRYIHWQEVETAFDFSTRYQSSRISSRYAA